MENLAWLELVLVIHQFFNPYEKLILRKLFFVSFPAPDDSASTRFAIDFNQAVNGYEEKMPRGDQISSRLGINNEQSPATAPVDQRRCHHV